MQKFDNNKGSNIRKSMNLQIKNEQKSLNSNLGNPKLIGLEENELTRKGLDPEWGEEKRERSLRRNQERI